MIAETALQGVVDVIGLSILSGAHLELCPQIMECLGARRLRDIPVVVGGIISEEDIPILQEMGIRAVFGPGTSTQEIVDFIETILPED
jgi:methylmalonyl-CoA mutase C-terminal domain/subunit